jgi:geranylgeranyl reductase family protein
MSQTISDWDLIVVGAGPAGTSTALSAIHAGPRLRVLLVDRADFPRDKSCGDGIAPHVFDRLSRIGVTGVEEGWTPLTRLELARGTSTVARPMARPVYVIPREVFDARLVERAVAAGATLVRHRVADVRATDEGIVLDGRFRAPVVVGADGAHSVLRGHLGLPDGRRALAIRGYAPTPPERRGTQVIRYGDRRQPSYAWAFDRGDGLSNVGYGELLPDDRTDSPTRALLLDQLDRLLPGSVEAGDQWKAHHLPLSGWTWEQPDGPVLLTGDAAGLINPMTGEGIYYAVATGITAGRSAAQAFRAANPARAGELHRRAVRALLGRHLKHTWTAARLAESATLVEGGIRAAQRDARVFDELVELGLGDGRISKRLVGHLLRGGAGGVARRTVHGSPLARLAKGS